MTPRQSAGKKRSLNLKALAIRCAAISAAVIFPAMVSATENEPANRTGLDDIQTYVADSLDGGRTDIMERLLNLPNIEVGKGVTFRPRNNSYEMTLRFRMQNMVGLSFNRNMGLTSTDAQVKRLRLRFDGYIFSPKSRTGKGATI